MSRFRVIVTIDNEVSPELYVALNGVPARLRAERIRTLATVGLTAVPGSLAITKPAMSDSPATDQQEKQRPARALHFAKLLGDGV